jgi:hypothetical protein
MVSASNIPMSLGKSGVAFILFPFPSSSLISLSFSITNKECAKRNVVLRK